MNFLNDIPTQDEHSGESGLSFKSFIMQIFTNYNSENENDYIADFFFVLFKFVDFEKIFAICFPIIQELVVDVNSRENQVI